MFCPGRRWEAAARAVCQEQPRATSGLPLFNPEARLCWFPSTEMCPNLTMRHPSFVVLQCCLKCQPFHGAGCGLQVLDKNTVKLVASEYDLLVVDKEEVSVTDAAKKTNDFLELEDLDHAVSVVWPSPAVRVCVCTRHQLCMCTHAGSRVGRVWG